LQQREIIWQRERGPRRSTEETGEQSTGKCNSDINFEISREGAGGSIRGAVCNCKEIARKREKVRGTSGTST
jgi:hypothetical protein